MFCWLGLLAFKCAPVYAGLEDRLPVTTRLATAYGPVACPLLGVLAAMSLICSGVYFRRRWVQQVLIVVLAILVVCVFRSFLFSGVFMGPAHRAKTASDDGGSASQSHAEGVRAVALDGHCWTPPQPL